MTLLPKAMASPNRTCFQARVLVLETSGLGAGRYLSHVIYLPGIMTESTCACDHRE